MTARPDQTARPLRRIGQLLLAVAAGLALGLVVRWQWGSDAGFLAVPALVALAWLFVADPTRCGRTPRA